MNIKNYKKIISSLNGYTQNPKLLAVTKYSNIDEINDAIENGVKKIGENRVEIAQEKFKEIKGDVEKHFIGVVQTKRLRKIFNTFDIIESIGNIKQLKKIDRIATSELKKANIFLQFNISNEQQKSGFTCNQIPDILETIKELKNTNIIGIMGMASNGSEDEIRNQFKYSKKIFDELKNKINTIKELSIGMSNDYYIALEEGATIIRVGSALFKNEN